MRIYNEPVTEGAEEFPAIQEQTTGLSQAKELVDLTPVADHFFDELNKWNASIEKNSDIRWGKADMALSSKVEELGLSVWEKWGQEKVNIDKELQTLAGVYLTILGSYQKMTSEDISVLKQGLTPLSTETGWNYMLLSGKYIESISRRKRTSPRREFADKISKMEEEIWQAFKKEETPSPST